MWLCVLHIHASGWIAQPCTRCALCAVAPGIKATTAMQFGSGRPPPEIMDIVKPAYKGAARGGTPFVAGTEKDMVAIWNAMVKVYGSRADALTAVKKNQQVVLPYVNTPECIVGAHASLVTLFGKDGAADIIRKNPGVLACNPESLAQTPRDDIVRAANFVSLVDGIPPSVKESIPFLTFLGLVGTIGGRVISCSGRTCGSATEWDLKGGLGVQLKTLIVENLPF